MEPWMPDLSRTAGGGADAAMKVWMPDRTGGARSGNEHQVRGRKLEAGSTGSVLTTKNEAHRDKHHSDKA